ncbi:MAG: ribonuclease R [Thermoanaerobaculaceae bacterium]|nr:ribonuclease R [Thermoanaerobaculaceae bacterium]
MGLKGDLPHRRALCDLLRQEGRRGATVPQLLRRLREAGFDVTSREALEALLAAAEERGEVVRIGEQRYCAIEHTDHFVGTLRITARGLGILRQEEEGVPTLVVSPDRLAGAMDGDTVLVRRLPQRGRRRQVEDWNGAVVRVLRRRRPLLVGRFVADRRQPWVAPFARRVDARVLVTPSAEDPPRDGEFVEVALEGEQRDGLLGGTLVRRLGMAGEPGVAEAVVLAEHGIPVEFPPATLEEAEALPAGVSEVERAGRVDYRWQAAVTVDGESAKDFDDAVAAGEGPGGAIEVFVHIADVSHYVPAGSHLDAAARERGTSVYLPGRCVPMLPERLSNDLCSLLPGADRLAFTVRFLVTPDGGVERYRAERSVFCSRRRCTYTEVFSWLEGGAWPRDLPADVRRSLELLDAAAQRLGRRRAARGSLDFDLPEPEILLDPEGFMTGVSAVPRNRAHRLIEELMVAANECVARLLVWGRQPALFRVHDRPSAGKLAELQAVLESFSYSLKGDLEHLPPRELQRILAEIQGRPEERLLQTLVLRSLARAAYSNECRGHYGLATDFYLHFTSPIRRYPDLVVHRSLAGLLAGQVELGPERAFLEAELADLASHCSFTERRAAEAERAAVRWKQAEFMRSRIGQVFSGHITAVLAFGVVVQLDEVFVEGLVHVADLHDDYYRYDEFGHRLVGRHTGRELKLGAALQVRVVGVVEETLEVRLEPVGQQPLLEAAKRPRRAVPRRPQTRRAAGRARRR